MAKTTKKNGDKPEVKRNPVNLKMGDGAKDQGKDKPDEDKRPNINEKEDWQNIREGWAKEQIKRAEAHALSFFEVVDDDLPLSRHLLLVIIASFFVIFVLWANWATLDEVTRGDGKVIPSSEIQSLQTLEAGIVEEFMVREGPWSKKARY